MNFSCNNNLSVRTETGLAMGGDGQVTLGDEIMKANTVKVRALSAAQLALRGV